MAKTYHIPKRSEDNEQITFPSVGDGDTFYYDRGVATFPDMGWTSSPYTKCSVSFSEVSGAVAVADNLISLNSVDGTF